MAKVDLNVLSHKSMSISPLVVRFTQASNGALFSAKAKSLWMFVPACLFMSTISGKNLVNYCWCVFFAVISFLPRISMVSFQVFRVIFTKFKIFYSIICRNSILVMDTFIPCKFSSKMLFHDMTVFKNSLSVYVYAHISKWCRARLAFFEVVPIWRNIIISMPTKPTAVHWTDMPMGFSKNIFATFNFADSTQGHILNYSTRGKECQE